MVGVRFEFEIAAVAAGFTAPSVYCSYGHPCTAIFPAACRISLELSIDFTPRIAVAVSATP